MSLVFTDSFDDGMTAQKWANVAGNGNVSLVAARNGNGLQLGYVGSSAPTHFFPSSAEHATLVVGFAFQPSVDVSGSSWVQFRSDAAATTHVAVQINGDGSIRANGASSGVGVIRLDVWQYVEIKAVLSDTVGSVDVRVDGVSVLSVVNVDTKNGGTKTVFDALSLGGAAFGTGRHFVYDDLYVCNGAGTVNNDFLGDVSIEALRPTSDVAVAWTPTPGPSNYTAVNDSTYDNTTHVQASATGQKDVYALGNLAATGGPVRGVMVNTVADATDSGGASMNALLRVSATDYTSSALTLDTTEKVHTAAWDVNPGTVAAWTVADVNALDAGVQS